MKKTVWSSTMRKGTAKNVVKASEVNAGADVAVDSVVAMSLHLDLPRYKRLRQLSFDKGQPMTKFIERGVDLVLKAEKH